LKGLEDGADVTIVKEDSGEIAPDPIDDSFAAGKAAVILDVGREPVNAQPHGLEGIELDFEKHPGGHDRVPEEILQHGLGDAEMFWGIAGNEDVHVRVGRASSLPPLGDSAACSEAGKMPALRFRRRLRKNRFKSVARSRLRPSRQL